MPNYKVKGNPLKILKSLESLCKENKGQVKKASLNWDSYSESTVLGRKDKMVLVPVIAIDFK